MTIDNTNNCILTTIFDILKPRESFWLHLDRNSQLPMYLPITLSSFLFLCRPEPRWSSAYQHFLLLGFHFQLCPHTVVSKGKAFWTKFQSLKVRLFGQENILFLSASCIHYPALSLHPPTQETLVFNRPADQREDQREGFHFYQTWH